MLDVSCYAQSKPHYTITVEKDYNKHVTTNHPKTYTPHSTFLMVTISAVRG